jgi:peptide/nickel transport system substrate-binding protein
MSRFLAGETDLVSRLSPRNAAVIRSRGLTVEDAGPSHEYNFLFFNLTDNAPFPARKWFAQTSFRQAVSLAIDRQSMVKLAFAGMAVPLRVHVTPGNKSWADPKQNVASTVDVEKARQLLRASNFNWDSSGLLVDDSGKQVQFSILAPSSSVERAQMATLIADDLKALGITAHVVTLEFRSLVDRILKTHDYDSAVMALGAGDGDPNSEINVWLSSGGMHLWNPGQARPATTWEAEIDELMKKQEMESNTLARRRLYWRVQEIEAEQLPIISLVSPHALAAHSQRLHNFRPVILGSDMLWNADALWVDHQSLAGAPSRW